MIPEQLNRNMISSLVLSFVYNGNWQLIIKNDKKTLCQNNFIESLHLQTRYRQYLYDLHY